MKTYIVVWWLLFNVLVIAAVVCAIKSDRSVSISTGGYCHDGMAVWAAV